MLRCPSKECRALGTFKINKNKWRQGVIITSSSNGTIVRFTDGGLLDSKDYAKFFEHNKKYLTKCTTCGHKNSLSQFTKAYHSPMAMFDTDNLCDCGGEIWNDFEVMQRDIEPSAEFEEGDSQRKVIMGVKNTKKCERCGKIFGKTEIDRGI